MRPAWSTSVALGNFDRQGFPDEEARNVRLSRLSGSQVYADPAYVRWRRAAG